MKTKTYPEIGFLRLLEVIGDKKNTGIIPVSRPSWVEGSLKGVSDAGETRSAQFEL